jgi:sulfate transport system ATP-binding protein
MSIEARGISKQFGTFAALEDVSLTVATGELVALLGPSGSGKTTLLRIIAGLEAPDAGEIFFHGEETTDTRVGDRQVGFVFQHYALFRHMNVFENVAFGLRIRPRQLRPTKQAIKDKVNELIGLVQLDGMAERFPAQLSGGQRQRVALARALAVEPRVLLLDEPFGALDARVREELRRWLRKLHDDLHITSVFVTHDQEEALEVADRIVVMNGGRIEQVGTPDEVYENPANPFVLNFLGSVNLFHGRSAGDDLHGGALAVSGRVERGLAPDSPVVGYVRPHDVEIVREQNGGDSVAAIIRHVQAVGPIIRVELTRADTGATVAAELTRELFKGEKFRIGDEVYIRPRKMQVFADDDYSI